MASCLTPWFPGGTCATAPAATDDGEEPLSEIFPAKRRKPRAPRPNSRRGRIVAAAALGLTALAVCGSVAASKMVSDAGVDDLSSVGLSDVVTGAVAERPGLVERTDSAAANGGHPSAWPTSVRHDIENLGATLSGRMVSHALTRVAMDEDTSWHVPVEDTLVRVTLVADDPDPFSAAEARAMAASGDAPAIVDTMMETAAPEGMRPVRYVLRSSLDAESADVEHYHGFELDGRPALLIVPNEDAGHPRIEIVEDVPGPTVRSTPASVLGPDGSVPAGACTVEAGDGTYVEIDFDEARVCMRLPLHPDGSVSVPWDMLDEGCRPVGAGTSPVLARSDDPCAVFGVGAFAVTAEADDGTTSFTMSVDGNPVARLSSPSRGTAGPAPTVPSP